MERRAENALREATRIAGTQPTSAAEISSARNGHRQLMQLRQADLFAVYLTSLRDALQVNEDLRAGRQPSDTASGAMDIEYGTYADLYQSIQSLFENAQEHLDLDVPITAYRRIEYQGQWNHQSLSPEALKGMLESEALLGEVITDPGIVFAAIDPTVASNYPLNPEGGQIVMLTLEIRRGLVLPEKSHRSSPLLRHMSTAYEILSTMGQLIVEPGSRWRLESADVGNLNCWEIRLKQL